MMSGFALRGARCHACRRNALQSFVTIAGVSIAPVPLPRRMIVQGQQPWPNSPLSHARPFSASPLRSQAANDENSSTPQTEMSTASAEHVPWYLQDSEVEQTTPLPLQERQQLPPLPKDPPPILEELLPHLSVDIGLDDLSLLDLRGADPPPALGTNLVMVIGTARSVKHLNVSADRLCRWLRKTHKLTPSADGLIGRNELKIRLRRKARRAKLGKNIGRDMDGRDDGLTTGWICVNVGNVQDGRPPKGKRGSEAGFVGFGDTSGRAQVVVQMFIEEMRAEFDLDSLWNERLDERFEELDENEELEPQDEVRHSPDETSERHFNRVLTSSSNSRISSPLHQRRHIHMTPSLRTNEMVDPPPQVQAGVSVSGEPPGVEVYQPQQMADRAINISTLFQHLSSLPKDEARRELGHGPQDRNSTLFLQNFYHLLLKTTPITAVAHRFNLIVAAVILSHPGYTKTHLFEAFQDLACSGYDISETEVYSAVKALLSSPEPSNDGVGSPSVSPPLSEKEFDQAFKVLDHASLRGIDILHEQIFFWLFNAAGYQGPVRPDNDHDPTVSRSSMPVPAETLANIHRTQDRLIKAMRLVDAWFHPTTYHNVLRILHDHGNYDSFWYLWRKKVLRGAPRTKEDYLLLFQLHAERAHQRDTIQCLFDWVPMTSREIPPVHVDADLARAVMDCLIIADPLIEQKAADGSSGTFVRYWEQCAEVLKEQGLS